MQALVISEHGDCEIADLPVAQPERHLADIIAGPLHSETLTPLAHHLDMWSSYEPLAQHHDPQVNDIASQIRSFGSTEYNEICGTAVITARTDSGMITALSPLDIDALHRIVREIRSGWSPRRADTYRQVS